MLIKQQTQQTKYHQNNNLNQHNKQAKQQNKT